LGAEFAFAAGHFAVVNFMVVSGQMKKTVQNEDFDFGGKRVSLLGGLPHGRSDADGEIAGNSFCARAFRWERQHVRSLVFPAELAVELADRFIGGEEHSDLALEAHGCLRSG
jgi:hypothetical protein